MVIAQGQPLAVIILKRENTFIGAFFVGQEFAERVGIFEGRGLQRLETPIIIDMACRFHEMALDPED